MPVYYIADGEIMKLQSVVIPKDDGGKAFWRFTLSSSHTLGRSRGLPELLFWPCVLYDFALGQTLSEGDRLEVQGELSKKWHGPERQKRWSTSLVVREIKAHTRPEASEAATDQGGLP